MRIRFIGGGQLNEAEMPTVEVSRTLNCMHEAGRILITNSNLGHAMPTLAAGMEKLGGDNQTIFGGGVRHGERRRTVAFNFELYDQCPPERIGCVSAQRARDWVVLMQKRTVYENHSQDSRVKPCGERLPQLNAQAGTGGCNLPLVVRFHGCLTQGQPQTHRVYGQAGAMPSIGANSNGGQNQQAVLTIRRASGFKAGQSARARSVGYGEESCVSIGARMSGWEPTVVTFVKRSHAQGKDGLGERWERSEVAPTQNAFDGGGDVRTQTVVLKLGIRTHIGFDSKGHLGGATRESSPTIRAGGFDRSHANGGVPPAVVAFKIDALASNSMKSRNPNSGIHRVSAWPTIDTSSQSPTRNQGGAFVLKIGRRG